MDELRGATILVTGPAGQIAFPLAARLARDNEVWGIARFSDERTRKRCDEAGITTRAVDLADPNWGDPPETFDYVLHLAAAIVPGNDFDTSIRINAGGTGKLMARFRDAKACLMMSTCGVYLSPEDETPVPRGRTARRLEPALRPHLLHLEDRAGSRREVRLRGVRPADDDRAHERGIRRQRRPACDAGSRDPRGPPLPGVAGPLGVQPDPRGRHLRPHAEAARRGVGPPPPSRTGAATSPSTLRDMAAYIGELVGTEAKCVDSPDGIHQYDLDPTRRTELAGPCSVDWRDGVRRMVAARHPEIPLPEGG